MERIYNFCEKIINILAEKKYTELKIRGSLKEFLNRLQEYGDAVTNFPQDSDLRQYIEIFAYTNKLGYGADITLFIDNELSDLMLILDISVDNNDIITYTILDLLVQ